MSGYTGLLQPIVVRRSGTHEEMVEAAARASVAAWLTEPHNPAWRPWLAGSFGKTVRRARPVEVDRCREFFVASATVGDAEAFACLPVHRADMAPAISKLQVSGTDRERGSWTPPNQESQGPRVTVNLGADMSTGKTCAQVAHAVFAWALKQGPQRLADWSADGLPFFVADADAERFQRLRAGVRDQVIVIEDAGHTEVAPGTATTMVWL